MRNRVRPLREFRNRCRSMRKALFTTPDDLKEDQAGKKAVYGSERDRHPEDGIDGLRAFCGSHDNTCMMIAARTTPKMNAKRLIGSRYIMETPDNLSHQSALQRSAIQKNRGTFHASEPEPGFLLHRSCSRAQDRYHARRPRNAHSKSKCSSRAPFQR